MTSEEKKCWAVELLKNKYQELARMPKKDDFDEITRSRIKAFLGPWPRALEEAGLKAKTPKKKKSRKRSKKTFHRTSVTEKADSTEKGKMPETEAQKNQQGE